MSLARRARLLSPVLALSLVPAYGFVDVELTTASDLDPVTSENVRHVDNLAYPLRHGATKQGGTDLEFVTLTIDDVTATGKGLADGDPDTEGVQRTYSVAGSYDNGMHIVDVTDPEEATIVISYDCGVYQGDIQIFERPDLGGTYATLTQDNSSSGAKTKSSCYLEADAIHDANGGTRATQPSRVKNGSFIIDISDPYAPETVGFVPFPLGSHNMTVHPSGKYLYNSNSELITNVANPGIEIFDISDLGAPASLGILPLPQRPGLGTDSHDITFNAKGTRAYSAALSQTVIINTEDPAAPEVISSFMDPSINVEHQANPITLTDGTTGLERDFLIVEDEFAGAAGAEQTCPSGGVHVYDMTGELELAPVKVGYWNIDDLATTKAIGIEDENRCTAHVFELHEDEALMTIAFYAMGVSVVDLSNLVGVALGGTGVGMTEVGFAHFENSDTWAVKAPHVDRDGVFHMYGNDQSRGMDIYEVDLTPAAGTTTASFATGRDAWLTPLEADRLLVGRTLPDDYTPFCLLGDGVAS